MLSVPLCVILAPEFDADDKVYATDQDRPAMPATGTMSQTTDTDLAAMLAAGDTPDVVLLAWAGKSLPARLMPLHDDMLAALRLVRGLARAPAAQRDAARALAEALVRAARG
jgi:hypothetical protein